MNNMNNQKSSTASDFEFPCKPLLGPSLELMQLQPSLRVVQEALCGVSTWEEHAGGGNGRCWGGEVFLMRPYLHWQCQHGTVPYTVPYFTVVKIRCDNYGSTPYYNKYGLYRTNRNRTILYNSTSLILNLKYDLSKLFIVYYIFPFHTHLHFISFTVNILFLQNTNASIPTGKL
jgi:hypothetical protein